MSEISAVFTDLFSFFDMSFYGNVIEYVAINKWNDALYKPIYWIYFSDAMAFIVETAVAAWVVYKAVDATIHTNIGFYFQYADWSDISKNLGLFDIIAFLLFPLWAIFVIITAIWNGMHTWGLTNERLREAAADSLGAETPISPTKALKVVVLCFVSAMGVSIAGLGLGSDAVEMISMFDHYYDKTDDEATGTDRGSGDAAVNMIVQHLITILYGHFQLGVIALGAITFRFWLTNFDDEFTCDLQEDTISQANYASAFSLIQNWNDRASC